MTINEWTIEGIEREMVPQFFAEPKEARVATVKHANGSTIFFSQYADEAPDWYCDFICSGEGFVQFSHGTGSRSVRKSAATDEMRDALNVEAEAQLNPNPGPA